MLNPYAFRPNEQHTAFAFESEGPKGALHKLISFTPTEVPQVYLLALHNGSEPQRETSPRAARSNNGDAARIIDTVIAAIDVFLQRYPERWVLFYSYFAKTDAHDPVRMRLYRRRMTANYTFIDERVVMHGILPDLVTHEPYCGSHDYGAILFKSRLAPTA
ncbi:hypothetical protein [Hymenobacter sp. DG01]|uniref:DUF6934 family protein n=1 Tax=Hymenobacter sp. DG01 TaxID=2584940 RepID=UPI001124977B|nr:hypothetical protein [Hymenobacter sp. DG01]